jgi:Helicase
VNDICIVLRCLNSDNIATNARVCIRQIGKHHIVATTIEDKPRTVVIPRIRFNFKLPYSASFTITRTQFPLRLAYSMTYNKSQGQTLGKVLLDVTTPPFAHGHLYVALSRVRSIEHIRMFLDDSEDSKTLFPYDTYDKFVPVIINIYHRSILDKIVFA